MIEIDCKDLNRILPSGWSCCWSCHEDDELGYFELSVKEHKGYIITSCCGRTDYPGDDEIVKAYNLEHLQTILTSELKKRFPQYMLEDENV